MPTLRENEALLKPISWLIRSFGARGWGSHPCGLLKGDDPYAAHVYSKAALTHPALLLAHMVT
jgi:hypothetical protein